MGVPVPPGPKETEVPQEPWGSQAPRASTVTQGSQVNKDWQEFLVKEARLGKTERSALPAHLDQLAWQGKEESKAHRASTDSRGCLATKGPLESQESQVIWVFLERAVQWVRLDQGESEAFPEREGSWVQSVCREPRGSLERRAPTGQRAALVHLEQ